MRNFNLTAYYAMLTALAAACCMALFFDAHADAPACWHAADWSDALPDGVLPVLSDGTWVVPNPVLTPGAIDPEHTEAWLEVRGHIKEARNVQGSVKQRVFKAYHVAPDRCNGKCFEIDHDIPLELGGSNDESNLWPQPRTGVWNAWLKDRLEDKLHLLVMHKQITLSEAQDDIHGGHWILSYLHYIGPPPTP